MRILNILHFRESHPLARFFLPSSFELIPYFFGSLLILTLLSSRALLVILSGSSPLVAVSVRDILGEHWVVLSEILATPLLGRLVLFIFWLGVGSVVYVFVWFLQNITFEVYSAGLEIKLKHLDDKELSQGWWNSRLAYFMFFGSGILILLIYAILLLNIIFPLWAKVFQAGLLNVSMGQISGVLKFIISIIGTALFVHLLVLLVRIFVRARRLFYLPTS